MNYLTRPVFETEIDWKNPVNKLLSFDLGELALGFGAEFFTSLQSHVVQGWQFTLTLPTLAEIEAFETFFDGLNGRLKGFWLPTPFEAMQWYAAVDGTHFDIVDQNLRDAIAAHPDVHLIIDGQPCKITAVALVGDVERVTVDSILSPQPSALSSIRRLHYVRLAEDVERGTFLKEGAARIPMRVWELPHEYTAFETGTRPIYLYHFWTATPMDWHWRYTSFAADVVSGNNLFSKFAIAHGALKDSIKLEPRTLDISAKFDATHPFALFLPIPFSRPLFVEVSQVDYGDLETIRKLFTGQVRTVSDSGEKLTARCEDWLTILLRRKSPGYLIGPLCGYDVYDPRTCKVERADFETVATLTAKNNATRPATAVLTLNYAALPQFANWITEDWFKGGFIETGFGLDFEVRTILSSVQTDDEEITIELNLPLVHAEAGQLVQLVRGCDGKAATCRGVFNNFINAGIFEHVPEQNLSVEALDAITSQGDKK